MCPTCRIGACRGRCGGHLNSDEAGAHSPSPLHTGARVSAWLGARKRVAGRVLNSGDWPYGLQVSCVLSQVADFGLSRTLEIRSKMQTHSYGTVRWTRGCRYPPARLLC